MSAIMSYVNLIWANPIAKVVVSTLACIVVYLIYCVAPLLNPGRERTKNSWDWISKRFFGRQIFSWLVGNVISPYSGSIYPFIEAIGVGHATISMTERRAVRNPFRSVHAAALTNLGELCTALAVMYDLEAKGRAIPKSIAVKFHAKARGHLTAKAKLTPPSSDGDLPVTAEIKDSKGKLVCEVTVVWAVQMRASKKD